MTEKEKTIKIQTSRVSQGDTIYEQIYNCETKETCYQSWNEDEQKLENFDTIIIGNREYSPIRDELLEKNAIILPTGAIEYGEEDDLDREIADFIKEWLDISEEHLQKAVWYVRLSWIVDKLQTIPYLRALGDYGTGKTRYLDVLGGICYKPMFIGGAVKAAPIYRIIDLWRGTAIFDEFTLTKSDETEGIIQILNNGYERGKAVLRCDTNNVEKIRAFDPFGAKILAGRTQFTDKALESRCITEIMASTPRTEIPSFLTPKYYEQRCILQNKLLMYKFKKLKTIKLEKSIGIDLGFILPRIKQSLLPFTVLFQDNPKKLAQFIKDAEEYNTKIIEENANSFDGAIVNAYLQLKCNSEPYILAKDVADFMMRENQFKDVDSRLVGRHLKALGFHSKPKKWEGRTIREITIPKEKWVVLTQRYVLEEQKIKTEQKNLDEKL